MAKKLEPAAQQLEQLAQIPEDQPVAMINLLQFNQPDGVEHYERYARDVQLHLERVGGIGGTDASRFAQVRPLEPPLRGQVDACVI